MEKEQKGTHGGPGRGQGRHRREAPKSKGIWCGQISEEQRDFIMQTLTPEERLNALLQAAKAKKQTRST